MSPKKQYDHSPHEVFVQLDELQGNLDEWKETARWIKYEEDVQESDRWGKISDIPRYLKYIQIIENAKYTKYETRHFNFQGAHMLDRYPFIHCST